MPIFNWVFENQPIASGTLTQPSHYKKAVSNLLADEKGSGWCLVKHLYYKFISQILISHIKYKYHNSIVIIPANIDKQAYNS